jgi:hypothetical protein
MTIHIPISDLELSVKKLYLEDKLVGGLSIDYALNALVGWYDEKEVIVFSFNKICKMDNRWTGYHVYPNKTEIIITILIS